MKNILIKLSLLIFCFSLNSFSNSSNEIDIVQYNLEVTYDKSVHKIDVKAILHLQKNVGTNEIDLLFSQDSKIKSIFCKDEEQWIKTGYEFKDNAVIHLIIPTSLSANKEINMSFEYEYPINDSTSNIIYIDRGYRWYPLIIDDIAKFRITANVPIEFEMFSTGDLVSYSHQNNFCQFIWESKIPVFKIPFILTKKDFYKKAVKKLQDKELSFCFLIDDSVSNNKIIDEACNVFQFYDTLIGAYHHNTLTFLEIPDLQGSIIGTGIILFGTDFYNQFKQGYYEGLHLTIATQWFGAGVFGKFNGKGFWFFSNSLPHYLRLMFVEHSKGNIAFNDELKKPYERYKEIAGTEKDIPILLINMIDTKEKGLAVYGKGPYILDILRKQTDETRWIKFLKELYGNYQGKILTYETFRELLLKINQEMKLDIKFEKMMSEKGAINFN